MSPVLFGASGDILATNSASGASINAPQVDDLSLVFHINLFILALFGVFSLLTLPRFFVRFSRGSEWTSGLFLHSKPASRTREVPNSKFVISVPLESVSHRAAFSGSDDSHTLNSHTHLVRRATGEKGRKLSLPPHMQSWTGRYHRVSAFLDQEVVPSYSIGRMIIVAGYFLIILYASVYKSSPFSDPVRTGFVAMSQIPLVFALATKNNILGMMLAVGYEKLNWLHRAAGRIVALAANIHALGYIYQWSLAGTFQARASNPNTIYGFIALVGFDLMVLFSTAFWRKKAYNVFVASHVIGFTSLLVGVALHKPSTVPWIVASIAIYALDHIIRLCKTRIRVATLRPIPQLGMTWIEIPNINAGWRAGQHVRIRVVSSGMGLLGRTESHPFTIASIGGEGMTLMCKKSGDWTNNLYNMAASSQAVYAGGERGATVRAKVILEGPYGGPGHTMFDSFSGAMFVAGGSGITYALAAVQDLVRKDVQGRSRTKVIELIWIVQDASALVPLLPTFTSLVQQATFVSLRISVFYTRASLSEPNKLFSYLPSSITIAPGRPRFASILSSIIDRSCALFTPAGIEGRISDRLSGVVVGVCGPDGFGNEVRKAVGGVDPRRYKAVGGIEMSEELFGW